VLLGQIINYPPGEVKRESPGSETIKKPPDHATGRLERLNPAFLGRDRAPIVFLTTAITANLLCTTF